MKHTKLPFYLTEHNEWFYIQSASINEDNFVCQIEYKNNTDKINAEFIVNACNAHYDLLEACKTMKRLIRNVLNAKGQKVWEIEIGLLEQAIKKAEE